jgi:hypothetical protein
MNDPMKKRATVRKVKSPVGLDQELAMANLLDGPIERIRFKIPRRLARHLRKTIKKGQFSHFVTQAIARQITRLSRLGCC